MKEEAGRWEIVEVDREEIQDFLRREWRLVDEGMFGAYDEGMWTVQERALACYEKGDLVGAAEFKIEAGLGKVTQLNVQAARRRRGLGRALMQHVEDVCRQEGCHKITLKTYWDSEAQRFYQALGYVVEAILRRDLHGLDMCQMCKFL